MNETVTRPEWQSALIAIHRELIARQNRLESSDYDRGSWAYGYAEGRILGLEYALEVTAAKFESQGAYAFLEELDAKAGI